MTPLFADGQFPYLLSIIKCVFIATSGSQHCDLFGMPTGQVFQGFFGWDLITNSVAVIVGASIAAFAIAMVLRKVGGR